MILASSDALAWTGVILGLIGMTVGIVGLRRRT